MFLKALCSFEISAVASNNEMEVKRVYKNVYENDFRSTVSKSNWFYSVTIISRRFELYEGRAKSFVTNRLT